ncbi:MULTISPECIES: hypothetical protein [Streptomyces]|uniref:Secreted protein n=2 Tax=Streptomyces TaxID=1883 RepID=A0ABT0P2T1_9ACTN|nr:hypothetical protein [Streptomyces lavenduligriseus]MCL3998039.1 hypothetical protein [Streptomyces lavenduligriseus]WDM14755.1 hypothetical protein J3S85_26540 [Streptomyces lavenduligriseus]
MNARRVRLAVLAPLAVSSLALGTVTFSASTAAAASPTCSVRSTDNPRNLLVSGRNFEPHRLVAVSSASGGVRAVRAGATGRFSLTITDASGTVRARQSGGRTVRCGTAGTGQDNARKQYREGFRQGFAAVRANCDATQPRQGFAAVDENFRKGFRDGARLASRQFCED